MKDNRKVKFKADKLNDPADFIKATASGVGQFKGVLRLIVKGARGKISFPFFCRLRSSVVVF